MQIRTSNGQSNVANAARSWPMQAINVVDPRAVITARRGLRLTARCYRGAA
jgi:hypothetical protein